MRKKKRPQWHPAFFAVIQIELEEEAENLTFENEHQLSTKPMAIDTLIIKKEQDVPIRKNIGRIFRKYNILEYKDPDDYLSIDDFYKVYGYTCFYKADTGTADAVHIEEMTISLVCTIYPRKLIEHLQKVRNYKVVKRENGIYDVIGDQIPIQIILTKALSRKENLWLKSLTNRLEDVETAEELIETYEKHKDNTVYQSIMDFIVRANRDKFEEAEEMCEALMEIRRELIEKEFNAKKAEVEQASKEIGEKIGSNRVNSLILKLSELGRTDELIKAASDREYQNQLFEEFGI